MLTHKFDYPKMSRETIDGTRKYLTPSGEKLPSVTTILSATKPEESKKALFEWRKRIGEKEAQAITTSAANRGTKMHSFLEDYIERDTFRPVNESIQSKAMADVIISQGLNNCSEFYGSEVSLYIPGIYAGSTDCVALHKNDLAIIDFKQTLRPKKREWISDYFLQLVCYGLAHNDMFKTNISKGVIMMCSGQLEYQEFILEGDEWKFYEKTLWDRLEQYYMMIS